MSDASDGAPASPLLLVRGLGKRFGGTQALDDVDLELRAGEIHALLGENGAGKSTLIKILAGIHRPDAGSVRGPDGPDGPIAPGAALPGIAFVHQDLGLVETMTVTENVAIGTSFARRAGLIDWGASRRRAAEALAAMRCEIDPDAVLGRLSAAEKSMVAIARALAVDARVLVLDEPTATLPEADVERFHDVLRRLGRRRLGILYVTHRLDEVFRVADRATVLRDGKVRFASAVADTDAGALIEEIVGRRVDELFPAPRAASDAVALRVSGLRSKRVGPVSFEVRAGEVVGLVGLRDAGQEIVGRMLAGDVAPHGGSIEVGGARRELGRDPGHDSDRDPGHAPDRSPDRDPGRGMRSPAEAIAQGIGFVSSKRVEESLCPLMAVRENLYPNPPLAGFSRIGGRRERERAMAALERFDVRPRSTESPIARLSGGNQQKVVIARWLGLERRVMVLEEPTSGVDVGAKAEIYRLLAEALGRGLAVVLVSSDFEEVGGLCDRAIVFGRDRQVGELARAELSIANITRVAGGLAA